MRKRSWICMIGFVGIVAFVTHTLSSNLFRVIYESFLTLFCGVLGIWFASQVNSPIFFKKVVTRKIYWIIGISTILMIAVNTIMWGTISVDELRVINDVWFNMFDTPFKAVLLSMRAGINEEIIYRLFSFCGIIWIGERITSMLKLKFTQKQIMVTAGVLSSVMFALFHTSVIIPLCMGLILVFIYYNIGLGPAMIVHTLTDLIPFLWVVLRLS